MFKDKILLITGGTGSFGKAVLRSFLQTEIGEIRIFSVMIRNRMRCAMLCEIQCEILPGKCPVLCW